MKKILISICLCFSSCISFIEIDEKSIDLENGAELVWRKIDLPLDSEEYKFKLKIIDFLKEKGLDYHKEPIPDFMEKEIKRLHPNDWQEYMQNIKSYKIHTLM